MQVMRLKFIHISTPLAGAMSACVELRSHYSQRFIARLAECRNGMRITSTEVRIPSPRLPVLVMRVKHRSLQTLPGTCIVHLLTTVPVLALAVSQAGFPSTSCYRSAATAFTTFVHDHLLRMLQSHMCARSFRFIERPLPFQTPTATTTSVMTATTQPLQRITTTLIIHHYSQSLLSSRV